jgi:hypothetical protein
MAFSRKDAPEKVGPSECFAPASDRHNTIRVIVLLENRASALKIPSIERSCVPRFDPLHSKPLGLRPLA